MENVTDIASFDAVNGNSWRSNMTVPDAGKAAYAHYYMRQVLAAILCTGGVTGAVGNGFVIVAVALFKKFHTATNVFVVNLAVADTLACLFMPLQVVAVLGEDGWPIPGAHWLCSLAAFVTVTTFGCSINNLALIAVNRWVGITKSRYTTRRIYTAYKLGIMVILAWAMPLCCALTAVLTDFGQLGYESLYSTCTWVIAKSAYYSILISAAYYPIQLLVITLSYTSIFLYVRKTSRHMTRTDALSVSGKISGGGNQAMKKKLWKRQLDVTKNLLYIVLAFLVCLSPYFTTIVFTTDWSRQLTPWAGAILFCNSCVNPFIYATSHPDFKEAFGYMIRCRRNQLSGQRSRTRRTSNETTLTEVNGHAGSRND